MNYTKIDDTKLMQIFEREIPKEALIHKKAQLEAELEEVKKALAIFN